MRRLAEQDGDQNESAEYRYPHCTVPSRLLKKRPLDGSFPRDQQFSGNNFKSIFGRIEIEVLQLADGGDGIGGAPRQAHGLDLRTLRRQLGPLGAAQRYPAGIEIDIAPERSDWSSPRRAPVMVATMTKARTIGRRSPLATRSSMAVNRL